MHPCDTTPHWSWCSTPSRALKVGAAGLQLELGNMAKSGELKEIWDVAQKTNLQFNMVR